VGLEVEVEVEGEVVTKIRGRIAFAVEGRVVPHLLRTVRAVS